MTELLAAMSLSGVAAAAVLPVSVVLLGLFGYRHGLFLATVVGLVLLYAALLIVLNLLVDFAYVLLDRRVRLQ